MDPFADVLIIGGSHAGLAAAQTLYRLGHTVIVLDSATSRPSPPLRLVPVFEGSSAAALRESSRDELKQFAGDLVSFHTVEIASAGRTEHDGEQGVFQLVATSGRTYLGRKLLVATGSVDVQPDVPGYAECWPQKM